MKYSIREHSSNEFAAKLLSENTDKNGKLK